MYVFPPEKAEEQARKGCQVKTTGKCSADEVLCMCIQSPLHLCVWCCWVGECVTVSIKPFGDYLKKSSMELQLLEKAILDESFSCCASLPPSPSK